MGMRRDLTRWFDANFEALVGAGLIAGTTALLITFVGAAYRGAISVMLISIVGLFLALMADVAMTVSPDNLRIQATERTLHTASRTLDHLLGGLTYENCQAICEILLAETEAMAVGISNREIVLGYAGKGAEDFPAGSPIHTQATRQVIETGKLEVFTSIRQEDEAYLRSLPESRKDDVIAVVPAGIVVPIVVLDETVGAIKFYYRHRRDIDRTQVAIARGFGELLSTQVSATELDRQAELTARAEIKALQAQINPHFLFNTLNTMAALTRTDPAQARELLREFATFYRQTLESSDSLISISKELEQTRRYLRFEYARFGEDRIIEREHIVDGCEDVQVPSFLVQPIVENAVRHAMRDEGALHIDIHVATEGDDVLISVTDDGLGMNQEIAEQLITGTLEPAKDPNKGTGVALRNVAERVELFYGVGSGVEIMSKPGEGTSVTIRLANASPFKA